MALSLLQITQSICKRIGLSSPTSALGNSDLNILQIVALTEEEGLELANRYQWEALQKEATFTTVATQIQSTLAAITTGFKYVLNETIWNRTLRRPVYGPKSPQLWQQDKAMQINGPFNSYRIIADAINFYPTPPAGQSCYFEYISQNWVNTSTSSTSPIWTSDADTPALDDQLIVLGGIWRWKAAKGIDYAEDFAKYERRAMDVIGRDAAKPTLSLMGQTDSIQPVILVPSGNW